MAVNKLLERLKKSIQKKQWLNTWKAFAIATSILEKNWYMNSHWVLTKKWVIKSKLPEWTKWIPSAKQRLKLRLIKK